MHFAIIDDVVSHHQLLQNKLRIVCDSLNIPCETDLATADWHDVVDFARTAPAESVYLLDIELNDTITGVELCRMIREQDPDGYIVYVSAYEQYALECCKSHAFDFLLKPWTDEQLSSCLIAIRDDIRNHSSGTFLTLNFGTRTLRLRQEDILYFSKERMTLTIFMQNGDVFQCRTTLSAIAQQLTPGMFVQCHKSIIVRLDAVRDFRWGDEQVVLITGDALPISRRRIQDVRAAVQQKEAMS